MRRHGDLSVIARVPRRLDQRMARVVMGHSGVVFGHGQNQPFGPGERQMYEEFRVGRVAEYRVEALRARMAHRLGTEIYTQHTLAAVAQSRRDAQPVPAETEED